MIVEAMKMEHSLVAAADGSAKVVTVWSDNKSQMARGIDRFGGRAMSLGTWSRIMLIGLEGLG